MGAVSLRCNRILIASLTDSQPPRHHRLHLSPGCYPLPNTKPGVRYVGCARASLCARARWTPRSALPPGLQLSAARAASRGSSGHAWSAGFDWAAVVVVTGKRPHSGLTVPGAARSPLVPTLPCSPRAPGAVHSPHGLRPGKVPAATGADPWAAGPGKGDHAGPGRPGR